MKKYLLCVMALAFSLGVMGQQPIVLRSIDKAECVSSDYRQLKASFSFSTIEAEQVDTQRGAFSWLSMANTVIGGNEGEPQIPVINELIAVPFGANPRIEITSFSSTDYRLEDYGIHTLVPRQPSLRKDKNPEDVPFVMNEAAYQSSRGFRSTPMATVNMVGIMRGVQLGKMSIEPVSYDPVNNTVRVFNNIEVTVHFDGADARATEDMLVKSYSPYFDIVYKQLFNERAVRSAYDDHPDLYKTPVKMLVVATSAYQSSTAFQNWLTWKKQKGIDVDIYTVTSSTASSTIRTEIQSRYNANHPTFLVIVGDETVVPAYKTNWSCGSTYGNCINDLEYASMDGDVYHDMFMSRMSVSSTTELSNLVNKILTYEKYTMSDPTYLNNSLLVAGWDSSWTNKVGKPTIQYANNNYYNSAHGINPTVYITTASGQTAAYNNINNVGFLNYTAHGDIQELADPEFTNSSANSMTNNDKYLWVVANCCLSANWGNNTYKPCLGETMIRAANKGAFGYIGSIPESYWYEDYYFGVGAFSYVASTVQTTSSTTTGMYDAAFDDTGFNTLNSMPYIGNVAVTYAHAVGYTSSVTDEYYWRAYQCLGDGSVMPYLNNPAANNVSHNGTLPIGATSYTVSADARSYVSITVNNEIIGVAEVPAGSTSVNVPVTAQSTPGTAMIVVTRAQRQPYIGTINIVGGTQYNITVNQPQHGTISAPAQAYANATVTLTATPETGYCLSSWTVKKGNTNITVTNNQFTMPEGDVTVTATFVQGLQVTLASVANGSISADPLYALQGTTINLTATPAEGYKFGSWLVYKTGDPNTAVTVNGNSFTMPNYPVTVSANFVLGPTELTVYDGTATNQYIPMYGYYFDDYTKSECIIPASSLTAMNGCTITAITFYPSSVSTRNWDGSEQTVFLKEVSSTTLGGSYSGTSGATTVKQTLLEMPTEGEAYTITFDTPYTYEGGNLLIGVYNTTDGSYNQVYWYGTSNLTSGVSAYGYNSSSLSSVTYNAQSFLPKTTFTYMPIASTGEPVEIIVSANPTNGGTVTGAGTYDTGTTVTLTATANEGYTFTNWTRNGVVMSTDATYSFVVTAAATYVANFTPMSYVVSAVPDPVEGGTVAFGGRGNRDELVYDFEDGWQGWTTFQGNTTSPNSWMHNTAYPTSNNNFSTGYGYNSSDGFMLSESYISGSSSGGGTAVTPDNYLVSPQVRLGGSISFYAGARNTSYCAEKFSVMVSTTDNTNAASFTTVGTWTLSLTQAGYNATPYTVDLSAYSGMGYIAIRHFDCYDQWFLCVDNVTIVEGEVEDGSISGTFNYGESCTLVATPNADYHFVNWTENGTAVSSSAAYTFTVTGDRNLVANFSDAIPTFEASFELSEGWNWWSPANDIELTDFEAALGSYGLSIVAQDGSSVTRTGSIWSGNLTTLEAGRMYMVQTNGNCTIVVTATLTDPTEHPLILNPGPTWMGILGNEEKTLEEVLLNPTHLDYIKTVNGLSVYYQDKGWKGSISTLKPGQGYIYNSNADTSKTINYPSAK